MKAALIEACGESYNDYLCQIADGSAVYHVIGESEIIYKTTDESGWPTFFILAFAGDWLDAIDEIDLLASEAGCVKIMACTGKPGVMRLMSRYGFTHVSTIMERVIHG